MTATEPVQDLIDRILSEGPVGMAAAARLYGTFRQDRPTHPSTPTRHALQGVRLPDGRVVRLETVRIAGRLVTSRAAVIRFLVAQQPPTPDAPPKLAQSTSGRARRATAARKKLEKAGW